MLFKSAVLLTLNMVAKSVAGLVAGCVTDYRDWLFGLTYEFPWHALLLCVCSKRLWSAPS
jgi:hypothetical protein